jgi:hypothetical protein
MINKLQSSCHELPKVISLTQTSYNMFVGTARSLKALVHERRHVSDCETILSLSLHFPRLALALNLPRELKRQLDCIRFDASRRSDRLFASYFQRTYSSFLGLDMKTGGRPSRRRKVVVQDFRCMKFSAILTEGPLVIVEPDKLGTVEIRAIGSVCLVLARRKKLMKVLARCPPGHHIQCDNSWLDVRTINKQSLRNISQTSHCK